MIMINLLYLKQNEFIENFLLNLDQQEHSMHYYQMNQKKYLKNHKIHLLQLPLKVKEVL